MKIWKRLRVPSKVCNVNKAKTINQVAIFGFSDADENDKLYKEVFKVAKALAEKGYIIINGGGPGAMRAATLGAKEVNGCVVGVTFNPQGMTNFEGRDSKNIFDQEIKTDSYVERVLALMREGQVYVIFNGGTGTVSEFGMAWGLARLYFGHHKPLILYGKFWKKIMRTFKENMRIREEETKVYKIVDSPDEVLDAINQFEKEIERGEHDRHLKATKGDFSL